MKNTNYFLTTPHARNFVAHGKDVYCMYGKQGPIVKEGVYIGEFLPLLQVELANRGIPFKNIHLIHGGHTDSTMKHRATAINLIINQCGLDPRDCVHFEPHLNAAGMGAKWHKAEGHKIFHNGKHGAKKLAQRFDDELLHEKPYPSKSRGVTRKYFNRVKCKSFLTELFFMTNKIECSHYVDGANTHGVKLIEICADFLVGIGVEK